MQWSQVLLILMGQFSFLTCQLYEYHFVKENKSWTEARDYCKKHYNTDLATVYENNTEGLIPATEHEEEEAWIGLHNPLWYWSLPGEEYDADDERQWHPEEPNNLDKEHCVTIRTEQEGNETYKRWNNIKCGETLPFICYNAITYKVCTFHKANLSVTRSACNRQINFSGIPLLITNQKRDNYKPAPVSLPVHVQSDRWVNEYAPTMAEKEAQQNLTLPQETWIGLNFRDTWTWAAGSNSSFRNWEQGRPVYEGLHAATLRQKKCAIVLKNSGKWAFADCTNEKPFVCYEDKVILIEENMSWGEALDYCRENHYDLVSITSPGEQLYVQEKAQEAGTPFVWLGLRYTCTLDFWFWISDEVVEYENWNGAETNSCGLAGAMDREGKHQWFKKPDEMKFHFICTTC